jgi:hypothetical protein
MTMPKKIEPLVVPDDEAMRIAKPSEFSLDKFKSKRAPTLANVETLLTALPHQSISQAKDFVRLHPDEDAYWSPELCFVNVPIKGQKRDTLHLIDEEVAMRYLPPARILRFRLALATKPYDVFFLCHVPTRNEDNTWVASNLRACSKPRRIGRRRRAAGRRESKPTSRTSRGMWTPFRPRNGRRNRSPT